MGGAGMLPRGCSPSPGNRRRPERPFPASKSKVSGNGPGQSRPQSPLSPGTGPPSASRPLTAWSSALRPPQKALGSSPKPSHSVGRSPDARRRPQARSPARPKSFVSSLPRRLEPTRGPAGRYLNSEEGRSVFQPGEHVCIYTHTFLVCGCWTLLEKFLGNLIFSMASSSIAFASSLVHMDLMPTLSSHM